MPARSRSNAGSSLARYKEKKMEEAKQKLSSSLGSIDFDPASLTPTPSGEPRAPRRGRRPRGVRRGSTSSGSYSMNSSLSSSLNYEEEEENEVEENLDFLMKSPLRRQWKNKRFWATPTKASLGPLTTTISPEAYEAVSRRSTIRDSLQGMLSSLDDPEL